MFFVWVGAWAVPIPKRLENFLNFLALLTFVGSVIGAYFATDPFWQSALFLLASLCAAKLAEVTRSILGAILQRNALILASSYMLMLILLMCSGVIIYKYGELRRNYGELKKGYAKEVGSKKPIPYPFSDGRLADFKEGFGGAARTAFGTHCALFSDSVWNMSSTVSYRRIDFKESDPGKHSAGDGYLRIEYNLKSGGTQPFVGVFCPFSFNENETFDISRFNSLSMSMRLNNNLSKRTNIYVSAILYTRNRPESAKVEYMFPSYGIATSNMSGNWTDIEIPLKNFLSPPVSSAKFTLDDRSVYQFGIIILTDPSSNAEGSLDVTSIKFEE